MEKIKNVLGKLDDSKDTSELTDQQEERPQGTTEQEAAITPRETEGSTAIDQTEAIYEITAGATGELPVQQRIEAIKVC